MQKHTIKLSRPNADNESEAFLDPHGSVVAQATGVDVRAALPQVSAIAASDSACRLSPLIGACI